MPDWADSPADWEAILGVLVTISLIFGYLIRSEVRRNTKVTEASNDQFKPNHGTSLRDAIDRIESRSIRMEDHIVRVDEKLDRHLEHHLERE